MASAIPGAEAILPYILYSDASVVRLGGHTFHPLVAFSAAGSLKETRAANGYRHIGFLPVITHKSVGFSSKPTGSALFRSLDMSSAADIGMSYESTFPLLKIILYLQISATETINL